MNFPSKIMFRLIDQKTKKAVPNVAVSIVLFARKKNDYHVGPKISDVNGLVCFNKEDCLHEIESSQKFYLMDYSSSIEECLPKIALRIKPEKEIKIAVENLRKHSKISASYWDCSDQFLQNLEKVDNGNFVSKSYEYSEVEIDDNKILEVELEKLSLK